MTDKITIKIQKKARKLIRNSAYQQDNSNGESHVKVDSSAAVYATAVVEYLVAEILDLSGLEIKKEGKLRISPITLQKTIRGDEELDVLIKSMIHGSTIHGSTIPKYTETEGSISM